MNLTKNKLVDELENRSEKIIMMIILLVVIMMIAIMMMPMVLGKYDNDNDSNDIIIIIIIIINTIVKQILICFRITCRISNLTFWFGFMAYQLLQVI